MGSNMIVEFKLMPEGVDVDFAKITEEAKKIMVEFGNKGEVFDRLEPLAFGLKALFVSSMYEVSDLSMDTIADKLSTIDGIAQAEVVKMDLAMG